MTLIRSYSKYWLIVFSQPIPEMVRHWKQFGFYRYQGYAAMKRIIQMRHEKLHRKQMLIINRHVLVFVLNDKQLRAFPELRIFIDKYQIGEPIIWI